MIPDTHEGIVTQEEFDIVQQLMTSRGREQNAGGFENIFAGVIKCADCGYALRAMSANRRKRPDIIDCVQYTCNNYGRYGNVMCTAHAIEARDLFNAVLADINRFADMAVNDERAVRAIEKRLTETDQSKAKAMEKEQKKLNKHLAELDRLFSSLYEDKVMERITERNFEMISGKYQKEQLEIEIRLREVTETLNESYEMMLKLCLCVSQGIPLWDMPTQEGDVLYLCIEDTFCRIQGRLFHLPDEASNRLHFAVASSRLIVIDTLQKVRTASKDSAYASDYENISLIKDFADRHSLAVIVVHHIRKQNDSDVFNKVSGTTG